MVVSTTTSIPAGGERIIEAVCPPGKKVLGGGYQHVPSQQPPKALLVFENVPIVVADANFNLTYKWIIRARNDALGAENAWVWAICATA